METQIILRDAILKDAPITYKWFLDKKVRAFSFEKSKVSYEEHLKWFSRKIIEEDCSYLIAEIEGEQIGSIRGDFTDKGVIISFLIDSKHHGNGYGRYLLLKGLTHFKSKWPSKTMIGYVQTRNIASSKIFESLGFSSNEVSNIITYKLTQ